MVAGARRVALAMAAMAIAAWSASTTAAEPDSMLVAWRRDGRVHWGDAPRPATDPATTAERADAPPRVPLGSLWKLFIYAYLSERGETEPVYRCAAGPRKPGGEEDYCCEPGGSIDRDAALARSCGPYFDPRRLAIDAETWRRHWAHADGPAGWLRDLRQLSADREVGLDELLAALDAVPPAARRRARAALLPVLIDGFAKDAWSVLGTAFRFKTYSWHRTTPAGQRVPLGGGAGWTADGTPVWFGGRGASRAVLARHAEALARSLPNNRSEAVDDDDAPCVEVRFFARYPIRQVQRADGNVALDGPLEGRILVEFENGKRLPVSADRRLELRHAEGQARIDGRFSLDEYVGRVVDREGRAEPREAARALAVAARSYVVQQGARRAGCWTIDDASATQRVSPNPASAGALAAARFTTDLILAAPVRYHRDRAAPGQLSWRDTELAARSGERFDALLGAAFGPGRVAGLDGSTDCPRLPDAEAWLATRAPAWRRRLQALPGYEPPVAVAVCALAQGNPYADQRRNRIFVRDWMSGQGRLALTHEYIHLAFQQHPNGADEDFVEATAREVHLDISPLQ